jgi:hypothetical protein
MKMETMYDDPKATGESPRMSHLSIQQKTKIDYGGVNGNNVNCL